MADNNVDTNTDENDEVAQISDIDALVDAAREGSISSFKDMFDELMQARAVEALNTRKMEVAQAMFQDEDPADETTGELADGEVELVDDGQETKDDDDNQEAA
jgi:hypothetical protein